MFVVMGANGHVGSAVARTLLAAGAPVTVVTRDASRTPWAARGAEVAEVDVFDDGPLAAVLRHARGAFLLNPPAPPSTDTVAEETRSARAIARAVADSGIERVVLESTWGARPGRDLGDLGVLWELERLLEEFPHVVTAIRAAYYLSNWDEALAPARDEGVLPTLFPGDLALPMVAPDDIGAFAARLLLSADEPPGVRYVEGPARCSADDVAAAFAAALGRPVVARTTPREHWVSTLRARGFSEPAAASMAAMTATVVDGPFDAPAHPVRGETTLAAYVRALVAAKP